MINTLLLARSVNQAGDAAIGQNISGGTLVLFKSLITRMALVLTGFYLGIVTFGLDALQMLVAFAVTQIGYVFNKNKTCLLYTSPSPRDLSTSRMPSSA